VRDDRLLGDRLGQIGVAAIWDTAVLEDASLLATTANTAALCARAPVRGSRTPRAASAISTIDSPNASQTFWPMI
jgi:hypothetical protein